MKTLVLYTFHERNENVAFFVSKTYEDASVDWLFVENSLPTDAAMLVADGHPEPYFPSFARHIQRVTISVDGQKR